MDLPHDDEASKDPAVEKAVLSFDEDDFEGESSSWKSEKRVRVTTAALVILVCRSEVEIFRKVGKIPTRRGRKNKRHLHSCTASAARAD
jgi:hypothetical protein